MAKDPAYLFYSDNFLSGTMFFSNEQVGKYIRLLCAQHLTGHLNEKDMLKICGSQDQDIWSKFVKDSDGKFYNERLETEILKRKNFSESRSKNRQGKGSKKTTPKKKKSKTYDKDMEIGNENGIIDLGKGDQGKNLKERFEILRSNRIWIDQVCMAQKLTEDKFDIMLSAFEAKCITANEDHSITELMRYFGNWIPLNRDRILNKKTTIETRKNDLNNFKDALNTAIQSS